MVACLDGFPAPSRRLHALKSAAADYVVGANRSAPKSDITERMSGRRVHQPSGRSYVRFNPPRVEAAIDITGS